MRAKEPMQRGGADVVAIAVHVGVEDDVDGLRWMEFVIGQRHDLDRIADGVQASAATFL